MFTILNSPAEAPPLLRTLREVCCDLPPPRMAAVADGMVADEECDAAMLLGCPILQAHNIFHRDYESTK
jgi:hypothetical protein